MVLAAVCVATACVVVLAVRARVVSWYRSRVAHLRAEHALAGEARAEQLLSAAGYRVVARQLSKRYAVKVDGQPHQVQLRADYIVDRAGRRLVAEVKTGPKATLVQTRATRRQLLEYAVAFQVDAVLLVDAEAGRIQEVAFPGVGLERPRSREAIDLFWWIAMAASVAGLSWWIGG
jgi:hypothetical protein